MEIKFRRDTSFRKQFFVPDSFAHPAKMDAQLLVWLVENFTRPGEVILDPMAGSGTQMLACTLGRNVILVELEEKFCLMMRGGDCDGFKCALCNQRMEWEAIETEEEFLLLADKHFPKNKQLEIAFTRYGWEWTRKQILKKYPSGEHHIVGNWEQVKQRPQFEELGGVLGDCQIIQGDARQLTSLCGNVHHIISSPPFQEPDVRRKGMAKSREGYSYGSKLKMSSEHPDNISRLAETNYGDIDKIITSPPYSLDPSQSHMTSNKRGDPSDPNYRPSWKRKIAEGYCETKRPYADKIITSPPYAEAQSRDETPYQNGRVSAQMDYSYLKSNTENKDNISNLPYGNIDKIITSPPYEGSIIDGNENFEGMRHLGTINKDNIDEKREQLRQHQFQKKDTSYSANQDNIGNLKGDTYLEAMLQVYSQCFTVLKDGGLMILVVKPFIRDQKLVPLQDDTKRLCEQVGFIFIEEHHRLLPSQSFWRIIYAQRFPDAPEIDREYVLIFRK